MHRNDEKKKKSLIFHKNCLKFISASGSLCLREIFVPLGRLAGFVILNERHRHPGYAVGDGREKFVRESDKGFVAIICLLERD